MNSINGETDFRHRVTLYRQFDEARQAELEQVVNRFEHASKRLEELEADLADEKRLRQQYRKQVQDTESLFRRSQFVLVLVDGDGYVFKDTYLRDVNEAGGARAAHELSTQVLEYLRSQELIDPSNPDIRVMVNVYANRAGLAKHLSDADVIQYPGQLDQFFQSFTNSNSLFQFIDCGYGKERADAKLRDTFRFYAYDVHCKHVFLACCHDSGYVAELDRYRHDAIAAPKTILVESAQMGRDYKTLNFPIAYLNVFNTHPIPIVKKDTISPIVPAISRMPSLPIAEEVASPVTTESALSTAPTTWSSITASSTMPSNKKAVKPVAAPAAKLPSPQLDPAELNTPMIQQKGIPVNRYNQRVDLKMPIPTTQELDAFERRISNRKLCNRHHLANDCYKDDYCTYDHGKIDERMKKTLRYKARCIPCQVGTNCRDPACFYGHQCPWGRDRCTNPKCNFVLKGMHNVTDVDIERYVPAEVY